MLKILLSEAVLINYLFSIIRTSTPLIYGSMGAIFSKKAGTNNLAIEASMLVSAMIGCGISNKIPNVWVALFFACLAGLAVSFFMAVMFLKYKADPNMTSTALNTITTALAFIIPLVWFGSKGAIQNVKTLAFPTWDIPYIKDIPYLGQIISGHCVLTYIAPFVVFVVWYLLFKTPLGLRIRAAGENAEAAESVGINVYKTKIIAFIFTGVLCGFGGAYMSMYYVKWFTFGLIAGRGFIAVSACNLTNARPWLSVIISVLFGAIDALSYNLQSISSISADLLQMLPYLATIIGVVIVGILDDRRLKMEK